MESNRHHLLHSIFYPLLFVILLWLILFAEKIFGLDLLFLGLYPRTVHGLAGILFSPLLHANVKHLLSNTLPLLILGTVIFYFYRAIAFRVFFWIYFITGLWVWVAARDAYHIGASGLVYGFICFLFFSGVFRKNVRLLSISLFVVFLYGGTIWGIFPLEKGVSWESHLLGSLAGIITAYNFRTEGPKKRKYNFGTEEENELIHQQNNQSLEDDYFANMPETEINYTYLPKEEEE